MVNREFLEQVSGLVSDNPTKFIKIRDVFDDVFDGRDPGSANAVSDSAYKRICARFRDIDVPFSWCTNKESVYQLYKAVIAQRNRSRRDDRQTAKKSVKGKKKGLFGLFK